MAKGVVFDTNVIVSALLKPGSIPASLLALVFSSDLTLYVTDPILEEYLQVLVRPVFAFDPQALNQFFSEIRTISKTVAPRKTLALSPDEPDNRFLECAPHAVKARSNETLL